MKIKQTIGVNTGKASIEANQTIPGEPPRVAHPPEPDEHLAHYLARNGIHVPYLRDLLRIYTSYMRENEGRQLLDLASFEQVIAAIQRGDRIEVTEIFMSLLLQK